MKRATASGSAEDAPDPKKRKVMYSTYQKWRRDFDRDCHTVPWLGCETEMAGGKRWVKRLNCTICTKYKERIMGRRNYSERWITGADSLCTSNIRDHAHSDQHQHAMSVLQREKAAVRGESISSFAPIAAALNTLRDEEREKLRCKFDIAYLLAKELSFRKYPAICELEVRHGVNLGSAYKTETAAKTFTHYIAESERQKLVHTLQSAKFFSLLMDGSTDAGNIDNDLLLVVWFDKEGVGENVCTHSSYFKVNRPSSVSAEGLFQVLADTLQSLGITVVSREEAAKLVGIGTDGAAANVAGAGLKGLVEDQLPWVFWMWCLAHRLELAIKDALKGTSFDQIDEMLLRLYYIYERSPKKCRQLEEIVTHLKGCLSIDEGGVKPVRASGSRWIGHKWGAMKRILSKFGAYTNHLATLSEDVTTRPADRSKLKGYYKQWVNAKYLLGCAAFCDLLAPCMILSKVMQYDHLDILQALTSVLQTVKEIEKRSTTALDQWPTYAATVEKCTEEDGKTEYQCQELKKF